MRALVVLVILLATAAPAYAYTDPGTVGLLAQMGYVLMFTFMSVLMFFFRPIKRLLGIKDKDAKK